MGPMLLTENDETSNRDLLLLPHPLLLTFPSEILENGFRKQKLKTSYQFFDTSITLILVSFYVLFLVYSITRMVGDYWGSILQLSCLSSTIFVWLYMKSSNHYWLQVSIILFFRISTHVITIYGLPIWSNISSINNFSSFIRAGFLYTGVAYLNWNPFVFPLPFYLHLPVQLFATCLYSISLTPCACRMILDSAFAAGYMPHLNNMMKHAFHASLLLAQTPSVSVNPLFDWDNGNLVNSLSCPSNVSENNTATEICCTNVDLMDDPSFYLEQCWIVFTLVQLLLGFFLPSVLLYFSEQKERKRFLKSRNVGYQNIELGKVVTFIVTSVNLVCLLAGLFTTFELIILLKRQLLKLFPGLIGWVFVTSKVA